VWLAIDKPRPPHQLNPEVPESLETICLMALAKDPADRFRDMRSFAEALSFALAPGVHLNEPSREPPDFQDVPDHQGTCTRIAPMAYLRSVLALVWGTFRHPFRTTIVDLSTAESVHIST
jgi:hypothetical protein